MPAGNNGIVGIKPSVGRFSTAGVVPACYLLDCVSVFALAVEDGAEVARLMENADIAGGRQSLACGPPAPHSLGRVAPAGAHVSSALAPLVHTRCTSSHVRRRGLCCLKPGRCPRLRRRRPHIPAAERGQPAAAVPAAGSLPFCSARPPGAPRSRPAHAAAASCGRVRAS